MGNSESSGRRDRDPSMVNLLAQFDDPELQRLDLRSKNLSEIPEEITQLKKLVWLNLPNNSLTSLPDHLFTLTNLKTLRLLGNRLSSLPPSIKSLKLLSSLDLSKNDFIEVGDTIGELTSLTDLNFHWNIIQTISPELSKLTNMKMLNISLNALAELPNIEEFFLLETLDLSHNRLADVPPSVRTLTRLNSLNLAGNRIISLSGAPLLGLASLRTLDLQGNSIKSLPPEIGELTTLKYLRLRANELQHLPDTCSRLVELVELSLSQNFLLDLPQGLGALTQLQTLALYRNLLKTIDPEIGKLVGLREFGLGWNLFTTLPPEVGQLSEVAMCYINHNEITDLPEDFFQGMSKVQEITLNNNKLKRFPKDISFMTDIRKLDACSNELEELPDISSLPNLTWAEFGNNNLTSLPPSLFQILNLFGNKLTKIPAEISSLSKLRKLYLSYNCLGDSGLPPASAWVNLVELEELFLDGNKFSRLPTCLASLGSLTELGFSNNSVVSLDPAVLSAMTNLKKLHLTANSLSNLPSQFGLLTNLVELDISHNQLAVLPDEFGNLIQLTDLDLSDNALTELPVSFTQNCLDMRQLKISYNAFKREPEFSKSADQPKDRLWISATHNAYVPTSPTPLLPRNKKKGRNTLSPEDAEVKSESIDSFTPHFLDEDNEKSFWRHRRVLGWAEMCGRRPDMQDTLTCSLNFRGDSSRSFVSLFDGHAGEKSAELACQLVEGVFRSRLEAAEAGRVLPDDIEDEARRIRILEERPKLRRGKQRLDTLYDDVATMEVGATKGKRGKSKDTSGEFKRPETRTRSPSSSGQPHDLSKPLPEDTYIRVMTGTFRELHTHITRRKLTDGTAALVMSVEHDHKRLIIGNAGDERAVLARGASAVQLTTDHKPEEPAEKVRIYDCGGFVNEQKRVDGILSLSRALGDNDLQPHVTYEPDVYFVDLYPTDRFVVMACDGLWDVVSNQQAVDIASQFELPYQAATALRDYAHFLNSSDNISVIVYRLDKIATKRAGSGSGGLPTDTDSPASSSNPIITATSAPVTLSAPSTSSGASPTLGRKHGDSPSSKRRHRKNHSDDDDKKKRKVSTPRPTTTPTDD